MEIKNSYIVIGDNNFWYTTLRDVTQKELRLELKKLKEEILNNHSDFNTPNGDTAELLGFPTDLFAYEIVGPRHCINIVPGTGLEEVPQI